MTTSIYSTFDTSDRPLSAIDADAPPIIQALRIGITAPNAHNTQPWTIDIRSSTEASLYFDPARSLPFTDPLGRQVHISHGTLLEMTAIAATSLGYRAEFDILPEGEMSFAEFGTKPTAQGWFRHGISRSIRCSAGFCIGAPAAAITRPRASPRPNSGRSSSNRSAKASMPV